VRFIHSSIPKTEKSIHPLNNYFSGKIDYEIYGKIEKGNGN
jgi:hypothetical protein